MTNKNCPKCGKRKSRLIAYCTSCRPTPQSIEAKAKAKAKAKDLDVRAVNAAYGGTSNAMAPTKVPTKTEVKNQTEIIEPANPAKIKAEWLRCQCKICSRPVYYLSDLPCVPSSCHFCRLREIIGISGLLTDFLSHENKLISNRLMNYEEKQLLANRKPLRERIKSILVLYGHKPDELIDACAIDEEVSTIIYNMNCGQQSNKKRSDSSPALPKNIPPFLQGGLPGLGKRS